MQIQNWTDLRKEPDSLTSMPSILHENLFHAKSLCEGNNSFEISATQYQEFDRNMNIHQLK